MIWDNIREMYEKLDRAKIFSPTQAVEEQLKGPEDMLHQYRAIQEREKATRFLLILNESYSHFRSQILAMEPAPPLGRIYQLAV